MTASVDRRRFLRIAVGTGTAAAVAAPAAALAGQDQRRVYVLVLDGLRPDEVTPTLMPQLSALRAQGTWYRNARSLPVMET
ncbi:MAG: hypothetical protein ACRDT6_16980, partial [Micromonosporaceae bacterium]